MLKVTWQGDKKSKKTVKKTKITYTVSYGIIKVDYLNGIFFEQQAYGCILQKFNP